MTAALMYHELQRSGLPLGGSDPGYVRYVVEAPRFAQQMAGIASAGLRGVSLGEALAERFRAARQVVITFDDGCESDWSTAAPLLRDHGFSATFYVVSGWIGRRTGFMSAAQLRQLADAGFDIGSHSATHAFLTELGDDELRRELEESKARIEDAIGRPVMHLSCPGGRASRRVAEAARRAGYASMATSRVGVNRPGTDPYALSRCAIHRSTSQRAVEALCRGTGIIPLVLKDRVLGAAKALAGNRLYDSLRSRALRS